MIALFAAAAVIPAAPADAAQMVFFRSGTLFGGAISCAVHENGTKVTSLPPGQYAVVPMQPGPHDFTVQSEAKDTYKVEAHGGATYYAKCTVGAGVMAGHPHLTAASESDFLSMSEKLKPVKRAER